MKLLRPDIPTRVRIKVARRQLEGFGASAEMLKRAEGERQDIYLDRLLTGLSLYFENLFRPLHLDHDPALVNDSAGDAGKKARGETHGADEGADGVSRQSKNETRRT